MALLPALFDATAFFRRRAEDTILIEEIENTIKDYITLYFRGSIGEAGQAQLQDAIEAMMPSHSKFRDPFRQALSHYLTVVGLDHPFNEEAALEAFTRYLYKDRPPSFDELTLSQYIDLFTSKIRWDSYKNAFQLDRDAIIRLLDDVRKIRNKLMHFRDEISINERTVLRYCKEWLERHRSQVEAIFPLKEVESSAQQPIDIVEVTLSSSLPTTTVSEFVSQTNTLNVEKLDNAPEEIQLWDEISLTDNSRYAPLALYLLNKPFNVEGELLTFSAIEEVIKGKLPASARQSRSWWANDSVGHVQSRQWLDVGWRVSYVDMEQSTVLFTRIHDRQKLYIDFFNALLVDLNQKAQFHLRKPSPNGQSWVVIAGVPEGGPIVAYLAFSFARYERFRVELYIDRGDKERNKFIFDALHRYKDEIEDALGEVTQEAIQWERIDDKRAARIALYHKGSITDSDEELAELRSWAINAMIRFQKVMEQYVNKIMSEGL